MGRLPVTAAIDIIRAAREQLGVEIKTHNPCGLKGFYITTDQPSPELTALITGKFKELGAVVDVTDDETTFVYKYFKRPIESKFATTLDNARIETERHLSGEN